MAKNRAKKRVEKIKRLWIGKNVGREKKGQQQAVKITQSTCPRANYLFFCNLHAH
jgi:hypothetical protein